MEVQFDAFSYPALEQIIDHVAKMRGRTRGRVDVPITIRMPAFGGIKGKEHHGESPETYYVHTAGLKVVSPSDPGDAYRLLRLAIADPDPVIVLEPKARYWAKDDVELSIDGAGIGEAAVVRNGDAATVFAYGAMVARCLDAAATLAEEHVSVRVVDLRSLVAARHRPHRAMRAGDRTCSGRARSPEDTRSRRRGERAYRRGARSTSSRRRCARVTGYDVPYPPASLEQHFLPSVQRIAAAMREVVAY